MTARSLLLSEPLFREAASETRCGTGRILALTYVLLAVASPCSHLLWQRTVSATPAGTEVVDGLAQHPEEWERPLTAAQMQDILQRSCRAQPQAIEVISVAPVIDENLFSKYSNAADEIRSKHGQSRIHPARHELPYGLDVHSLESTINEGFYFHGRDRQTVENITHAGFGNRCSAGLYGEGLYFTPEAWKALQYATPSSEDGLRTLILARVVLGDPFYTDETRRDLRSPPERPDASGALYDSVVGRPKDMPGEPEHTQIVVFNGCQAYPAYVVRVKVPSDR
eukprot:gnl/TRDRNA2_/TRDRNA2_84926_c0_seq1.p1 gnl/TRDRNA2_/TRDRNA2_84926_c0~~gnl/TRDRNA2_/TRDRNA2_84926_c0_seq1.p1  ORF type:complete len:282 (+),score=21.03 gnl/TRDRNA2_/TRDRNA2_84926_c0_seq1:74-919(+)